MAPKINDLQLKSADPRVYTIMMHEDSKHTITSHHQTEFRKYATTDPNILSARADGQQGKVWLHAKDSGKADLSFEARNVTIPLGILPKGKSGIYADNAWTAVKIEATVVTKAKPPAKPKPKPDTGTEVPAKPQKPRPPRTKASPAAKKVVLAENYLENDRPEKVLELLDEAEGLEGADEQKKKIAALRKLANKAIKDNG